MIKVTLEFHSVPEAIIALNAIMNLPEVKASPVAAAIAEVKAARRGRADKGQKRGEYKPRETNTPASATPPGRELEQAGNSPSEVTDARNATAVAAGTSTVSQAPATEARSNTSVSTNAGVPSPAEVIKAEIQKQQAEHAPVPATIGEKDAEAQKVMEVLHGKKGLDACRVLLGQFGVSRIREIPTARRAEFLEEAGKAAA